MLSETAARPAVFLDRDGTLNEEVGRIRDPDSLRLIEGVGPALCELRDAGFLLVLVTNQAVVARGECTEEQLARVHARLTDLLARDGACLDALYHCPHHPQLTGACGCRKPAPGMIHAAVREWNIDLGASWMIGDSTQDVQTARNAGVAAVLLQTGHAGRDGRHAAVPDFEFRDLTEAARFICERGR